MVTVRFPSGVAVQYNEGWYLETHENGHKLFNKKGGDLLARLPLDCIIEWVPACRVYNATEETAVKELRAENESLRRTISALKGQITKLKK